MDGKLAFEQVFVRRLQIIQGTPLHLVEEASESLSLRPALRLWGCWYLRGWARP